MANVETPYAPASNDPVGAARALHDRIVAVSDEIERERRLPPDLVEELRRAGLFHLMLPRDLGGVEAHPVVALRAIEEVSAADGSAGWCVMLAAQSGLYSGYLDPEYAREIWGNGGITAGVGRPIGRAVPVSEPAEGYIVSGRWPFASGASHATWFGGECKVYDSEQATDARLDPSGTPISQVVFAPRDQVTVHDTWDTTGLRGTASHDFSLERVFVPAGRSFAMLLDEPVHPWPVFRALALVFATHGAHALGVGRGAVEAAKTIAREKRGWGNQPLREVPRIQLTIAEATVTVRAAREHLYAACDRLWEATQAGEDRSDLRAETRLATTYAAQASLRAVDMLHGALGTSAIFAASPLERPFRDIHTALAHVMVGPLTYEAAGRVELGDDPAFPFF